MHMLKTDSEKKMPCKKTAITPEQKMYSFAGALVIQLTIFIAVVYATVYNNSFASNLLSYYIWFICFGIFFMVIALVMPLRYAVEQYKEGKFNRYLSPSTGLLRGISLGVSAVEIGLFLSHEWYWFATVWVLGDITQYLMIRHYKKARNYVLVEQALANDPGPGQ